MTKKRFATFISTLGNPLILSTLVATFANFKLYPFKQALQSTGILVVLAILPIFLFINRKVKTGKYADYDVSARSKRPSLYLFGIAVLSIMIFVLYKTEQPKTLIIGAIAALGLSITSFLFNFFVKTSLHTAFAFFVTMMAFFIDQKLGFSLFYFAILVGWSRLVLGRHSANEVIVGAALGFIFGGIALYFSV